MRNVSVKTPKSKHIIQPIEQVGINNTWEMSRMKGTAKEGGSVWFMWVN